MHHVGLLYSSLGLTKVDVHDITKGTSNLQKLQRYICTLRDIANLCDDQD